MLSSSALSDELAAISNDRCSPLWDFPRATESESTNIRKRESTILRKCESIRAVGRPYHHSIIQTRRVGSLGAFEGMAKVAQ